MHELLGGAGIGGEDDVLLGEVDLQFQLVQGHPVLQVAVQAVGLLDKDDAGLRVLAKIVNHLAEAGTAGLFSCLHVDVLFDDVDAFCQCVVAQQLELGRDGKAFLLLLLGRDAGIDDCIPPRWPGSSILSIQPPHNV